MSDERDTADAADDDAATEDTSARGRTAVATEPVTRPLRPTGKRHRAAVAEEAEDAGEAEAEEIAEAEDAEDAGEAAESSKKKPARAKKDAKDTKAAKAKRAAKAKKAKKKSSGPSINPIVFVYHYLKEVVAELRKVIWPNRKQMITYTSVVLGFLVFMVALIFASDFGFAKLVTMVFGGEVG